MPLSSSQRRQRKVLRRFGHLLDLTCDMDRSTSDRDFLNQHQAAHDTSRQIHYVFDENVFELFIDPSSQPSFCSNFYSKVWSSTNAPESSEYSSEAGLIAAEYLFSSSLPGLGKARSILLTEWHYTELKSRLFSLKKDLEGKVRDLGVTERNFEAYRQEIAELVRTDGPTASDVEQYVASKEIDEDVAAFLKEENDNVAASRFIKARRLASLLTQDRVVEPLHQLSRLYTDVLPRVRPLNQQFKISDKDKANAKSLIQDWIVNLQDHYGSDARSGRVQFDARSIAYVHWVAKNRLSRDERIVLVTGDSRLFDAYRSWYRKRDVGEAFLLRKVNQYAPLLNPHDMPNDIADASERGYYLFDNVRRAIDAPLLTFNIVTRESSVTHESSREHMAGLLSRSKAPEREAAVRFFTHSLDEKWWSQRDDMFSTLRRQWRTTERLAIGTSLPILEHRQATHRSMLSEISSYDVSDERESFSRYLHRLLDTISIEAMRSDLPDAISFTRGIFKKDKGQEARAPLELLLEVPVTRQGEPEQPIEFASLMDKVRVGDATGLQLLDSNHNSALRARPDILFAVAAGLAIRGRAWMEAERFADNAVTAAEPLEYIGSGATDAKPEYLYLQSLARRFVIASLSPAKSRDQDEWRSYLERSINVLNSLESLHENAGDHFRQLRAVAERVATRLFYVSWGACTSQTVLEGLRYSYDFALSQYSAALADVRHFWRLCDRLPISGRMPNILQNLNVNAASLAVIGKLLGRTHRVEEMSEEEVARLTLEMEKAYAGLEHFPKIVAVDVTAFLFLVANQNEVRRTLIKAVEDPELGSLDLDLALTDAIRTVLRGTNKKPQTGKTSRSPKRKVVTRSSKAKRIRTID